MFVDLRGSTIFTGDGLMALCGLNAKDPAIGVAGALCGAREMMARAAQLNSRLRGRLDAAVTNRNRHSFQRGHRRRRPLNSIP